MEQKLRYRNNTAKDIVVIDILKCSGEQLHKLLGRSAFAAIDKELLDISFYIYKRATSWLQVGEKKYEFNYTIYPTHPSDKDKGEYTLTFTATDKSWMHRVYVKDCCYPKKQLIKYLLNAMSC